MASRSRAIAVSVLLTLAGCVSAPSPVVETVTIKPDTQLLADCPVPEPERNATGQVVIGAGTQWAADLLGSLLRCNADKAALRDFYAEEDRTHGR